MTSHRHGSGGEHTEIRAVGLDFDGVICDSIRECMLTSYQAYRSVSGTPALPRDVSIKVERLFLARRGFVRPSGHYYLLWKWITQFPERRLSPNEFEDLEASSRNEVEAFATEFHSLRDIHRTTSPREWVALNPLYAGVTETWPLLTKWPCYIVTTKDRASVEMILGRNSLVTAGIFARGEMTKPDALHAISSLHGVAGNEVILVDDNALHLTDVAESGFATCLAAWGYGPRKGYSGSVLESFVGLPTFLENLRISEPA